MIRRVFPGTALVLVVFGLLAIGPGQVAVGQSAPNTSCISGVTAQPLSVGQPMQAEGYSLMLVRVTFAPGGSIGLHTHPGSLTLSIESGALLFSVQEGEMDVVRAPVNGTAVASERLTPGDETVLQPGDSLFEHGMVHSASNASDGPTSVLIAGLMRTGEPFTQCVAEPAPATT
jgi:quercetin dioxygenase-like cupin family protein